MSAPDHHYNDSSSAMPPPPPAHQSYLPPLRPKEVEQGEQPSAPYEENGHYDRGKGQQTSQEPYPHPDAQRYDEYEQRQGYAQSNRQNYGGRDNGYGRGPPPGSSVGSGRSATRQYAPGEPRPNENNQLAPYDEEKAYAQYHSAYGSEGYSATPPVASDYDPYYGDRNHVGYPRYAEGQGPRRYSNRPMYNGRDGERNDSRHSSNGGYDNRPFDRRSMPSPPSTKKDIFGQGNGQRGLGAALLGGAAGALISHESGRGALGTLGGIAVGAIGANALEKHLEQRKEERQIEARRQYQGSYETGGSDPYYMSRGSSRRDHRKEKAESMRNMREHYQRKRAESSEDSWTSDE